MEAQLVLPDIQYKYSYIKAVQEYKDECLHNYKDLDLKYLQLNFDEYVQKIKDEAKGIGLPEGYVPHTVFWLVDKEGYIGRLDIRHKLNEYLEKVGGHIGYDIRPTRRRLGFGKEMLRLGLLEAKKLGISEAIITCDFDNVASKKIIEANGGTLIDTVMGKYGNEKEVKKNRYTIRT